MSTITYLSYDHEANTFKASQYCPKGCELIEGVEQIVKVALAGTASYACVVHDIHADLATLRANILEQCSFTVAALACELAIYAETLDIEQDVMSGTTTALEVKAYLNKEGCEKRHTYGNSWAAIVHVPTIGWAGVKVNTKNDTRQTLLFPSERNARNWFTTQSQKGSK